MATLEDLAEIVMEDEKIDNESMGNDIDYTPVTLQILGITEQLKDLNDYFDELPNLQSQVDEELSDLLHYIESNDLTPKQSVKMIKLLQQKRLVRRGLCNDYEIKKVYNTHRNKLVIDTQRQFFLSEVCKKAKELNSQYRYRQFGVNENDTAQRKVVAEDEIKALLK